MDHEKRPNDINEAAVTGFEINHEVNDTELLISRLRHPVIKKQVIQILYKIRRDRQAEFQNGEWEPYIPEGWGDTEQFKFLKSKQTGKITTNESLEEILAEPIVTEESVEEWYDDMVDHIASVTEFDYSTDQPDSEIMHLGWIQPWNNEVPTTRQWAHIEAHEKGHRVRGEYYELDKIFQTGFDISKATFTDEDYQMFLRDENRRSLHTDEAGPITFEQKRDNYFEYLFSAQEIAERMSQLKNYFGFSGAEVFTKEHLKYAREHYLNDIGLENGMRHFFEAITPETEEKFLLIINNYGI